MSLDDTLTPSIEPSKLRTVVVLLVLLAGLCQVTLQPDFLPPPIDLPIASLAVWGGFLLLLVTGKLPWIPLINWTQVLYLSLLAIGLAATRRAVLDITVAEIVHALEIMVIAAWIYQAMAEKERALVGRLLGWSCPAILALTALNLHELPFLSISTIHANAFALLALPFFVSVIGPRGAVIRLLAIGLASALAGYTFIHGGMVLIWVLLLVLSVWRLLARPLWVSIVGLVTVLVVSVLYHQQEPSPWLALRSHYEVQVPIEELEPGDDEYDSIPTRRHVEAKTASMAPRWMPIGGGPGHYHESIDFLSYYVPDEPYPDDPPIPKDGYNQYLVTLVESSLLASLGLAMVFFFAMLHCMTLDDEFDNEGEMGPAPHSVVGLSLLGLLLLACFCVVITPGIGTWAGALLGMALYSQLQPPWHSRLVRVLIPLIYLGAGFYLGNRFNVEQVHARQGSVNSRLARAVLFNDDSDPFGLQTLEKEDPYADGWGVIHQQAAVAVALPAGVQAIPDRTAEAGMALASTVEAAAGTTVAVTMNVPRAGRYRLIARLRTPAAKPLDLLLTLGDQRLNIMAEPVAGWQVVPASPLLQLSEGEQTLSFQVPAQTIVIDWWELWPAP